MQLTVQIPSEQSFAVYNAKKSLVAGSPDTAMKVKDTWVFERALKQSPSTRCCLPFSPMLSFPFYDVALRIDWTAFALLLLPSEHGARLPYSQVSWIRLLVGIVACWDKILPLV